MKVIRFSSYYNTYSNKTYSSRTSPLSLLSKMSFIIKNKINLLKKYFVPKKNYRLYDRYKNTYLFKSFLYFFKFYLKNCLQQDLIKSLLQMNK